MKATHVIIGIVVTAVGYTAYKAVRKPAAYQGPALGAAPNPTAPLPPLSLSDLGKLSGYAALSAFVSGLGTRVQPPVGSSTPPPKFQTDPWAVA